MQSVAGVIYPVDVQGLVIRGIVAIHIGIGVMDNSMDVWSLVQSVESSWDTMRFEYDALRSFIWTTSSRRSYLLMAMTQCLLQLDMQAVMTNSGRSFSTANLRITIFHFFWKHLHSLDTVICSALFFRAYSISQGMSRVCPFPFSALVWPFEIFLLGRWLEIYPSTSKQFCGCDPSGLISEQSTDCWAFTWFCMTTSLPSAIHHSLFVGRHFSAVFQPGRGLHVFTSGFEGVSRTPAFE